MSRRSYTAAEKAAFARKMAYLRGLKQTGAYVDKRTVRGKGAYSYKSTKPPTRTTRTTRRTAPRKSTARTRTTRGYGAYDAPTSATGARRLMNSDPRYKGEVQQGRHFSSDYGSRLGSVVGEGLQSLASVFGLGDYKIKRNSLLDLGQGPPTIKNTNKGEATIIHHREYIGELMSGPINSPATSTAFTCVTYPINIGNSSLFPFGSAIAQNYQEWEVRGLIVYLKSESSDFATNSTLGTMFCAVDYNFYDQAPSNKQQLENLEYAMSAKPSCDIMMPIECAPKNDVMTHLYVEIQNDGQGDQRFYNIGNLFIGSYGCPAANAPISEMWITYEIALFKPRLWSQVAPLQAISQHWAGYQVTSTRLLGVASGDAYPESLMSDPNSNFYVDMDPTIIGLVLPLPSVTGYYNVIYTQTGSNGSASPTATLSTSASVSGHNDWSYSTGNFVRNLQVSPYTISASNSIFWNMTFYIDIDNSPGVPPTLTFNTVTVPGGSVYSDLVYQYLGTDPYQNNETIDDFSTKGHLRPLTNKQHTRKHKNNFCHAEDDLHMCEIYNVKPHWTDENGIVQYHVPTSHDLKNPEQLQLQQQQQLPPTLKDALKNMCI